MINFTLSPTLKNIINLCGDENDAYLFILMFRNKWLKNNPSLTEKDIKENFPPKSFCVSRCIVHGNSKHVECRINHMLSILKCKQEYEIKDRKYNLLEIYEKYPEAFSLMMTIQPRNLISAAKNLTKELVKEFIGDDKETQLKIAGHIDILWLSKLQRYSDNRFPMILIDIDTLITENDFRIIESIFNEMSVDNPIIKHLFVYGCTTPSGGCHLIFDKNSYSTEVFFKDNSFRKRLSERLNISKDKIEILTTNTALTHVVGVNPLVKELTL